MNEGSLIQHCSRGRGVDHAPRIIASSCACPPLSPMKTIIMMIPPTPQQHHYQCPFPPGTSYQGLGKPSPLRAYKSRPPCRRRCSSLVVERIPLKIQQHHHMAHNAALPCARDNGLLLDCGAVMFEAPVAASRERGTWWKLLGGCFLRSVIGSQPTIDVFCRKKAIH